MKFNEKQIKNLQQNTTVLGVVNRNIYYTKEFKEKAIQEYLNGKSARQIFIDAGFNLQEISNDPDYATKTLSKWRQRKHIISNIHYPQKKINENKSNYDKMKAKLEYLEAENEFLKKLQALNNQFR